MLDEVKLESLAIYSLLDSIDEVLSHLKHEWEEYWPHGICTIYCLLEAPILRAALHDPDLRVLIGKYKTRNHCWMRTNKGYIIDPTYSQFRTNCEYSSWEIFSHDENEVEKYINYDVLDLDKEEYYRRTIRGSMTDISKDYWRKS